MRLRLGSFVLLLASACGGPAFPTAPPDGATKTASAVDPSPAADTSRAKSGLFPMAAPNVRHDPEKPKCPVIEKLQSQGNVVSTWREALVGIENLAGKAEKTRAETDEDALHALCAHCTDLAAPAMFVVAGPHAAAGGYVVPRKDGKLSVHVLPRPSYVPPECNPDAGERKVLRAEDVVQSQRFIEMTHSLRVDERECTDMKSRYLLDRATAQVILAVHGPAAKYGKDEVRTAIAKDEHSYTVAGGGCSEELPLR